MLLIYSERSGRNLSYRTFIWLLIRTFFRTWKDFENTTHATVARDAVYSSDLLSMIFIREYIFVILRTHLRESSLNGRSCVKMEVRLGIKWTVKRINVDGPESIMDQPTIMLDCPFLSKLSPCLALDRPLLKETFTFERPSTWSVHFGASILDLSHFRFFRWEKSSCKSTRFAC